MASGYGWPLATPEEYAPLAEELRGIGYTLAIKTRSCPAYAQARRAAYLSNETRNQKPETRNQKPDTRNQKPETMKTMIENYVNGNLAAARKQARRHSHAAIRQALIETLGYSLGKAALTADWLKTGHGFQAACDAE